MTRTQITNFVPAFALRQGMEFFDGAGNLHRVSAVDTDVAAHGGYVAVWVGPERILFSARERVDVPVGAEGLVR